MSVVESETPILRDFYDPEQVSDAEVRAEQARVHDATGIEREWIASSGMRPFAEKHDLRTAFDKKLERVHPEPGMTPIWSLREWTPDSKYSPPYLRPRALYVLRHVAREWADHERFDDAGEWSLSVTSMVRSTRYQRRLRAGNGLQQARKIAINTSAGEHSSHEYGTAFDIDGCGLYMSTPDGFVGVHPRTPHEHHQKVVRSRRTLQAVLAGIINVVEEAPGTQQWCFHVATNPTVSLNSIIRRYPLNAVT